MKRDSRRPCRSESIARNAPWPFRTIIPVYLYVTLVSKIGKYTDWERVYACLSLSCCLLTMTRPHGLARLATSFITRQATSDIPFPF